MMQCWQNKDGDYCRTNPLFFIESLKRSIFLRGPFSKPSQPLVFMLGRVFLSQRKVILMGMGWRIGDGKSIDIYGDNWL